MSTEGKRYKILRRHPDGKWRPIVGLVYTGRKNARNALGMVAERYTATNREVPPLRIKGLR